MNKNKSKVNPEFVAEIVKWEDLNTEQRRQMLDKDIGNEESNYLRILHYNSTVFICSDMMKLEDATFLKDLKWLPNILRLVFFLGTVSLKKY